MQNGDLLYANDFVDALKKKHVAKSYKKMVSFIECFEWIYNKVDSLTQLELRLISMHYVLNILYVQSNHIKVSLFRLTPKTSFLGEIDICLNK